MNIQASKLYALLLGLSGALMGCLALSAMVQAGSQAYAGIAVTSDSSYAAECILFRDGFDLTQSPPPAPGERVEFVTGGGYTISVNLDMVLISDPMGLNRLVHSGVLHEYLNGKHIKDWGGGPQWDDARRSLILDDGTKVTLLSTGHPGTILHTSIYDGVENLQIDNQTNEIIHQSVDPGDTQQRDAAQYDSEVATFSTDLFFGTATYSNDYNEDQNFNVIDIQFTLGTTGGCANPSWIYDFYDDPRRSNT